MAWRRRDDASTAALGLSVSTVLFAIAFVTANLMVEKPAGMDTRSATLDPRATVTLDLIVQQAGRTATASGWVAAPDALARFGLAEEGKPNFLDYRKIKVMRNATMITSANGAPDYPDVRTALGLEGVDLHLRTYPVIPGLEDPRWSKDPRGRVAYVGHVGSPAGDASMASFANTSGDRLTAELAIRNDGIEPMIFVANVGIGNVASDAVIRTEQRHTRLLAVGEVQTLRVVFPKMAYSPAVTGVQVQLSDAYGGIAVAPAWVGASAPTGTNVAWAPLLSAGDVYYETDESVKFVADHFTGSGDRLNTAQSARFVLVGPNGKEWQNVSVSLPKNKALTQTCSNCTAPGVYVATLWDAAVTRSARDEVYVSATQLFSTSGALDAVAAREVALLKDLVVGFNGFRHDETTEPEGDVFVDSSHIRVLDDVLPRYSTLVVGSEVKQNALNAGETKWAIADWVQAGGNLVVLGTVESQSHWLEPVYHAAQQTANGGISAPDPMHPVLTAPNRLNYGAYLDNARAWRIKSDQPFTHVLTRGATSQTHEDTLAVSAPGAYNDGTVVLTSYMAGALTSPQDPEEAKRFLHNLLSQSYTMLFLDFGPPIPHGVPVGSAQRVVAVEHPSVPNAVVESRIVLYTWDAT